MLERRHGRALDPVGNFHLRNGARVEAVRWGADPTAQGARQSAGLMVNYRYHLPELESNNEAYVARGEIGASRAAAALLPPGTAGSLVALRE